VAQVEKVNPLFTYVAMVSRNCSTATPRRMSGSGDDPPDDIMNNADNKIEDISAAWRVAVIVGISSPSCGTMV
jgi:uncharacterized protein YbbK (DUF523 family)